MPEIWASTPGWFITIADNTCFIERKLSRQKATLSKGVKRVTANTQRGSRDSYGRHAAIPDQSGTDQLSPRRLHSRDPNPAEDRICYSAARVDTSISCETRESAQRNHRGNPLFQCRVEPARFERWPTIRKRRQLMVGQGVGVPRSWSLRQGRAKFGFQLISQPISSPSP